jgi:hypothetical protein
MGQLYQPLLTTATVMTMMVLDVRGLISGMRIGRENRIYYYYYYYGSAAICLDLAAFSVS